MRRNQTKNMVLAIALGLALTGSVVAQGKNPESALLLPRYIFGLIFIGKKS